VEGLILRVKIENEKAERERLNKGTP
jgi:hypothetical protein